MKKTIFLVSGMGSGLLILLLFLLFSDSSNTYWDLSKIIYSSTFFVLFPLLGAFPFSLITYKLSDQVFQAWWKFASWYVPLLIALTFLIEWMPKAGGGEIGLYKELPYQFLGLLYGIFVLVSLIKIFLAWRRAKGTH